MTRIVMAIALGLTFLGELPAQAPELASLFPCGGQRGTTVDIALEGKNLADVTALFVSHPGITTKRLKGNQFSVTLAESVPEGDYDLWAVTPKGLTNPRRFAVGSFPEIREKEPNDDPKTAQAIEIPVVINGTLLPGTDRDWYRFDAAAGETITIHFRSDSLDGSARPALTLFRPDGKELVHDDGRELEPTLDFLAPAAGSYLIRVEERAYQKGDHNVYRLAVFRRPRAVAAFPDLLAYGKKTDVTLFGYRLPGGQPAGPEFPPGLQRISTSIDAPTAGEPDGGGYLPASAAPFDGFRYRHRGIPGVFHLGLTSETVVSATDERHDSALKAQPITTPVAIAGRFLRPRQADWYRVHAKKGQLFWIEGIGERAGKTMDLEVSALDAAGSVAVTLNDVALKKGETMPFPLVSLDPSGVWKADADGDYSLVVRDQFGTTRWGVNRTYRLLVTGRREEVTAVASPLPGGIAAAPGGSIKVPIAVLRRGGHDGPITIRAENLPPGLTGGDLVIPVKQSSGVLTLTAAKDAAAWIGRITLSAETELDRKMQKLPVVALGTVRGTTIRRCDGITAAILAK